MFRIRDVLKLVFRIRDILRRPDPWIRTLDWGFDPDPALFVSGLEDANKK